jgi:hypothetical protein
MNFILKSQFKMGDNVLIMRVVLEYSQFKRNVISSITVFVIINTSFNCGIKIML